MAGVIQMIRMMLDQSDAKRTEDEMKAVLERGAKSDRARSELTALAKSYGATEAQAKRAANIMVREMGRTEKAVASVRSMVTRVGAALAAAFAVHKIVQFGQASVREAMAAREEWARLGGAVERAGVSFESVRAEVEQTATAFQRAGYAMDEEFAGALTVLINRTGDFGRSMGNMRLVADIAAGTGRSMADAADVVGRAMAGQTRVLREFGLEAQKGADLVEILAGRFQGAADAADPLKRQTIALRGAWSDLQEAIGEAMVAAGGGTSVMDTLRGVIEAVTSAVQNNQSGVAALASTFMWFVRGAGAVFMGLWSGILTAGSGILKVYTGWVMGIRAVANAMGIATPGMDSHIAKLEDYIAKTDEAAASADRLARAIATGVDPGKKGPAAPGKSGRKGGSVRGASTASAGADKTPKPPKDKAEKEKDEEAERIRVLASAARGESTRKEALTELVALELDLKERLKDTNRTLEERAALEEKLRDVRAAIEDTNPAEVLAKSFDEAFKSIFDGTVKLTDAMKRLKEDATIAGYALVVASKGNAQGMIKELGKIAKAKVLEHKAGALGELAYAAASAAWGNFPKAGAHLKAAAGHAVALAGWSAIGGVASAMGGGGGASASGSNGQVSATGPGGQPVDATRPRGAEVHIHLDPYDPHSPTWQERWQRTKEEVRDRWGGDAYVTVG